MAKFREITLVWRFWRILCVSKRKISLFSGQLLSFVWSVWSCFFWYRIYIKTICAQPNFNQPTFGGQTPQADPVSQQTPQVREIYCANCSKKFNSNQAFCPHCGKKYNPCPRCGSDNVPTAHRCVSCGAPLSQVSSSATCTSCGAPLTPGAQFCSHCGAPQAVGDNVCPRCGAEMAPTMKFCPKCGNKR